MTDTPAKQPAKKTLTLGGTLSVGSGSAPRGGTGVAVEVRRRRFDAPSQPLVSRPAAAPVTPANDEEMQRRMQALQAAQTPPPPVEDKMPDDPFQKAAWLQQQRVKEVAEKARIEAEAKAAEQAAREKERTIAATRAGSGAGGVQSGTLNAGSNNARAVDSRDFTRAKAGGFDDAKRGSSGKPQQKENGGKRGRNAYMDELEQRYRSGGGGNRRRRGGRDVADMGAISSAPAEKVIRDVQLPEFITVGELAARMAEKSADVVKKLMMMGEMVTVNQTIDQATAELIVTEFGHRPHLMAAENLETVLLDADDQTEELKGRPPIVTIMGHVDHGKTTLLDSIRKTSVVKGEAGGITQHIGAYQITAPSGRLITFLDTPGHAAFTAMRARGAKVTDVVVLVVAADDGIMPQTIEAIQHAKAAGVPIVVAMNKMDKPGANPQKVKNELLGQELVIEEFGGNVPCVPVSALKGTGLGELEEIILLQADVLDLKANPSRRADGTVVEARLDKGRGPVATVIVQRGTLKTGDIVVAGSIVGRVRALVNDLGQPIKEAGPSMPVEILGLSGVPSAGDVFVAAADEKKAREVAQQREHQQREREQASRKMTLENLMEKMSAEGSSDLNVIVKADVQGSVEAIHYALGQLNADQKQVQVKVISGGVGVVTETDVNLASAAKAIIVGFNVRADATARQVAENMGIELRYYSIIYNLVDDIKAAMSGLLAPNVVEEVTGTAQIRALFKFEKMRIAGCMVTDGSIKRGSKVRLIRDGKVIYTGELATLKRNKDDAKEVNEGYECGMTFTNFTDFNEGDVVEAFQMKEIKRTIDDLKAAASKQQQETPAAEA